MPILKLMRSVPTEKLAAEGLFYHDNDALTDWQRAAVARFVITLQLEQESYMTHHPEIVSMMELLVKEFAVKGKLHCDVMKEAANFFLRPGEELEDDIRRRLSIGSKEKFEIASEFYELQDDEQLKNDLIKIRSEFQASDAWSDVHTTPSESTPTKSSSFISLLSSTTTLPTPEARLLWQNRMRKKMKKTLREHSNFRGYEPVSLSKGSLYKELGYKIPHPPCMCYPRSTYNRIPKDRFGIYLPREEKFETTNITISPVGSFSTTDDEEILPDVPIAEEKSAKFKMFDKSLLQRSEILKRRQADYYSEKFFFNRS